MPTGNWSRNPDVVRRVVAGEVLLIPVKGRMADLRKIYVLDAVSDNIWGMLDGTRSVGDLRDAVCAEFEVDPQTAEKDAVDFIERLAAADLARRT
jgi:hypothetical protein